MRFFLDHDVPETIAGMLGRAGHDVDYLRERLPVDAEDVRVLEFALQQSLVLVTCNRDDFLRLAREKPHSGIIIVVRRSYAYCEWPARAVFLGASTSLEICETQRSVPLTRCCRWRRGAPSGTHGLARRIRQPQDREVVRLYSPYDGGEPIAVGPGCPLLHSNPTRIPKPARLTVPASGVDTEFVLHDPRVMRKVTVTLPEDVAGWARVRAARGISALKAPGTPYPGRQERHERSLLR